jgi:hypothetical protein
MAAAIAQRITLGLGVVYVAVGLRGFIPGITVAGAQHPGHGLLLGIFAVNALHNVVHLAAGALLIGASTAASNTILVNRALAVVFAPLVVASLIAPVVEGVADQPARYPAPPGHGAADRLPRLPGRPPRQRPRLSPRGGCWVTPSP